MSLLSDSQARLWVGTESEGLCLLLPTATDCQVFYHDALDSESLSADAIGKIYEDRYGNIWLGTVGGGLNRYREDGSFIRYAIAWERGGDADDVKILDIVEDQEGFLWLATLGGGVIRFNPDTREKAKFMFQPQKPDSLSSNSALTLLRTENSIWVGTLRGLSRFEKKDGSFTRYSKRDGLASNAVYGLLADDLGRIWISGGQGLSVLDPQTNQISVYDTTHGLQGDDFTFGAFLRTSDGNFLFGGYNGFNAFDPLKIRKNTYVPPIRLTRFTKFSRNFDLNVPPYQIKSLQLDYCDDVIGFEFASMDFTAPQNNAYR